jgi:peptide methionine sulfoxide reductase MsrB
MTEKIVKNETAWKKELTPEQYRVTREAGTEPLRLLWSASVRFHNKV